MTIFLFQSTLKDLHRDFVTQVGASQTDLISEVPAVLVIRAALSYLSANPLTVFFLADHPAHDGTPLEGDPLFRTYLVTAFSDLLSEPSTDLVARVILGTVNHPDAPFQDEDAPVGEMMLDSLRYRPQ